MKTLLRILVVIVALVLLAAGGGYLFMANALPDGGPVQEIEIDHNNQALVERGKYLAHNVAGCIECHSPRHMEYFSMPYNEDSMAAGGMPFDRKLGLPGNFYPGNLTPAGIGDWSDAELYHTVTTGVRPTGEPLFGLMPYKNFGHSDMDDVKAILAYIRTLKPVEKTVATSEADFPVNLIMRTEPAPAEPVKRPHPSNSVEYGEYLVKLGNCRDCHTKMNKGTPVPGLDLAGGNEYNLGPMGTARSANLTPDKATGIGTWDKATFISMFKQYDKPEAHRIPWQEKGYQTVMPWVVYCGMTEEDLGAIYDYLRTIPAVSHKVEKWTAAGGAVVAN